MLERVVAHELGAALRGGEIVTAGLSGGIDSIVLLDLLRSLCRPMNFELRALHVNHGLNADAAAWERFCREHCRRRRIPFEAVRVTVAGAGSNVEAEARAARYRAFLERGSEVVALAHNRDDQAETVLMRLLRGAGVAGLAAMPRVRELAAEGVPGKARPVRVIRPLLDAARSDIETHARLRRLRWVDDDSNADPRFSRNFLRARIMPMLAARFPGCRENLVRAAHNAAEAAALLDALAGEDCAGLVAGNRINVPRLMALGDARAANALRHFLAVHGEPPLSRVRTRELLRQLGTLRRDAEPAIVLACGVLRRYREWIELAPAPQVDQQGMPRRWTGEPCVQLGASGRLQVTSAVGSGVSARRLQAGQVSIRCRRGGERMRLAAGASNRTLKNLLQESGVAPWRRRAMPLVFCDEQLVWAPDVGIACEFRAGPGEAALEFAWLESVEVASTA